MGKRGPVAKATGIGKDGKYILSYDAGVRFFGASARPPAPAERREMSLLVAAAVQTASAIDSIRRRAAAAVLQAGLQSYVVRPDMNSEGTLVRRSRAVDLTKTSDNKEPPAKRRKWKSKYDKTRRAGQEWASEFDWYRVEEFKGEPREFCTECREKGVSGSWAAGRAKFKKFDADRHQTSDAHVQAVSFNLKNPMITRVFKPVKSATTSTNIPPFRLQSMICVYNVMRKGRPMTDYVKDMEALALMRTPDLPNTKVTDDAGWEFADHMADAVQRRLSRRVASSSFFAISFDDTVSIDRVLYSNIEIYFLHENTTPEKALLRFVNMKGDGTGKNIQRAAISALAEINITPPKSIDSDIFEYASDDEMGNSAIEEANVKYRLGMSLVFIGSDGASANMGVVSGSCSLIKKDHAPYALANHCAGHRTSLCAKCLENIPEFYHLEETTKHVNGFFSASSVKNQALIEEQVRLNLAELATLKHHEIRWLSIESVLSRWLKQNLAAMLPIVRQYSQLRKSAAKAKVLLEEITDAGNILFGIGVVHVLKEINTVSKLCQADNMTMLEIYDAVRLARDSMRRQSMRDFYPKELSEIVKRVHNNLIGISVVQVTIRDSIKMAIRTHAAKRPYELPSIEQTDDFYLLGDDAEGSHTVTPVRFIEIASDSNSSIKRATKSILQELDSRFPDTEALRAFSLVDPRFWKLEKSHNVIMHSKFIDESMETINKLFGNVSSFFSPEACEIVKLPPLLNVLDMRNELEKWEKILLKVYEQHKSLYKNRDYKLKEILPKVLRNAGIVAVCPQMATLARIFLVFPTGSVDNERNFAVMRHLHNKTRNRLEEKHLNTAAILKSCAIPLDEFPYQEAYDTWYASKRRRGEY